MTETTMITCPYCTKLIPLDEALTHQIQEKLRKEYEGEIQKREGELKEKEDAIIQKEKQLKHEREKQQQEAEGLKDKLRQEFAVKIRRKDKGT